LISGDSLYHIRKHARRPPERRAPRAVYSRVRRPVPYRAGDRLAAPVLIAAMVGQGVEAANDAIEHGSTAPAPAPGGGQQPDDSSPRPPWVGGYKSLAPTTPGFAGYAGANRIVSRAEALSAYKPADSVQYTRSANAFDCECTLTDTQVLEFCRTGVIVLPGVVPDSINRQACDWLQGLTPANPAYVPEGMTEDDMSRIRATHEPSTILLEQWFIDNVLLNPVVAGAVRSLLGPGVGLPVLVSHHGGLSSPGPPQHWVGEWPALSKAA
jgi:hypothetical protein